jgi:hypothetical protein
VSPAEPWWRVRIRELEAEVEQLREQLEAELEDEPEIDQPEVEVWSSRSGPLR